jgi:translocation protein SEC66
LKERTAEIQGKLEGEKEWWEGKRKGKKEELLSELGLEDDEKPAAKEVVEGKSEDEAVLVEADDEGPSGSQAQQHGGSVKKRKGKK